MPFSWVRRVEQSGSWSDLPVSLVLRSSRLAAIGYLIALALVTLVVGLPIAAVASVELLASEPTAATTRNMFITLQVSTAGVVGTAAIIWLAYCAWRSVFLHPRITISDNRVEMAVPRLLGTTVTRTPLSAFDGLAVLPQSTLSGKSSGLYLLHPERRLSPLLVRDISIQADTIATIADAIGVEAINPDGTGFSHAKTQAAAAAPLAAAA